MDEARRIKLENIIVEKTEDDPENITEDILAKGVDELVLLETIEVHEQLTESQEKGRRDDNTIKQQRERIITLASKPYWNKIGWRRCMIYLIQQLGIILSAALLFISSFVLNAMEINGINARIPCWILSAIPTLIEVVIYCIDKIQNSKKYELIFTKKIVKCVYNRYVEKIKKNIANNEQAYLPEIIEQCVNNTPIFLKYKKDVDYM